MKNIMTRAWEIAKEAVKKFGGKVKEYFKEALKMAWNESKKVAFSGYEYINNGWNELTFKLWEKVGQKRVYINYGTNGKKTLGYYDCVSDAFKFNGITPSGELKNTIDEFFAKYTF